MEGASHFSEGHLLFDFLGLHFYFPSYHFIRHNLSQALILELYLCLKS